MLIRKLRFGNSLNLKNYSLFLPRGNMSRELEAALLLIKHEKIGSALKSVFRNHPADWHIENYQNLSIEMQAAISWAYCIINRRLPPIEWNFLDPFKGFLLLKQEVQALIIESMAIRYQPEGPPFEQHLYELKMKKYIESFLEP